MNPFFVSVLGASSALTPAQAAAQLITQMGGASNVCYLFDAQLGVTTVGGNNISAIADQTGNGNHITQGTSGNRPTLSNTLGVVHDGVDDFLQFSADVNVVSFGIACKISSLPGGVFMLIKRNATPLWQEVNFNAIGATYPTVITSATLGAAATTAVGPNPVLDTSLNRWIGTYNGGTGTNPANYTSYRNSVPLTVVAPGGVAGAAATNISAIGAFVAAGPSVLSAYAGSWIRQVGLTIVPNATQIGQIDAWLARPYP